MVDIVFKFTDHDDKLAFFSGLYTCESAGESVESVEWWVTLCQPIHSSTFVQASWLTSSIWQSKHLAHSNHDPDNVTSAWKQHGKTIQSSWWLIKYPFMTSGHSPCQTECCISLGWMEISASSCGEGRHHSLESCPGRSLQRVTTRTWHLIHFTGNQFLWSTHEYLHENHVHWQNMVAYKHRLSWIKIKL